MKADFTCDYSRGAHPLVMEALVMDNGSAYPGYGRDEHCARAERMILDACQLDPKTAGVYFLVGGTQTNALAVDALLRPTEGVIATTDAHVNVHEAGAIEATGHKVLTLPARDGKIPAGDLEDYLKQFYADDTCEHMVQPGMVYLSEPTELGTLYSLSELTLISAVCHKYQMPLYIDGARMAYALAADGAPSLAEIAQTADMFYIGGTKCGTLMGEALVVKEKNRWGHLFSHIKQHGALLAKGWLLGLQFETLFTDGLYYDIGAKGVEKARHLVKVFADAGYHAAWPSPANQQFFFLPNALIDSLKEAEIGFELWGPRGHGDSAVRFVTSWATTEADIAAVAQCLVSQVNTDK